MATAAPCRYCGTTTDEHAWVCHCDAPPPGHYLDCPVTIMAEQEEDAMADFTPGDRVRHAPSGLTGVVIAPDDPRAVKARAEVEKGLSGWRPRSSARARDELREGLDWTNRIPFERDDAGVQFGIPGDLEKLPPE